MKKFFRILMWVLIACIFIGTFVYLYISSRPTEVTYDVVSPSMGDIVRTTVLTGKIEPRDEIAVKPQVSGIISEICVEAGTVVNEGDIIARIKIIPDEGQLSSALSRIESARIALADAKAKWERNSILLDKKVISREEYETSETTYLQAERELEAARDAYSIVKEGVSVNNASESNTLVRATITGLVLDVPVKVGSSVIQANTMNDGTTVASIADMNNLIFKGNVDETEVGLLKVGMPMTVNVGALPKDTLHAVVEYIAPKGTESNGANTFELKGAISDAAGVELRSGYSANATVTLSSNTGVLTIPESIVEWAGDSTFVYVTTDTVQPFTFTRRPVTLGESDGINVEVTGVGTADRLRGRAINQ
ncbi:MAG: efflux RND transporter periplasmic adaptor subunit [Barnesiella sp.]|nr:efflux RND transporter periplasmic adaptor subunit [Bacteroidales bacterium]MBD5251381.1 efflux RND transporter periplasmic adaptor subunit [Barnesiella sp.]MBD5344312.1 efflux RND transporter periplasmic adaptor subunit [Bacteroides sp.]